MKLSLVSLLFASLVAHADALSDLTARVEALESNAIKVIKVPVQSWVGQPTPGKDPTMVAYDFQVTKPVSVLAILDGNIDLGACMSAPAGCAGKGSYSAPMQTTAQFQRIVGTSVSAVAQRVQMNALTTAGGNVATSIIMPFSHNLSANIYTPGTYRLFFSVHQNDSGATAVRLYNAALIVSPITNP